MPDFEHQRHKPPVPLERPRELLLCCPQLRSNVNLSRMVRLAGCAGIQKMIVCGSGTIDATIARDAINYVAIERRRSLPPVIKKLLQDDFSIVGLEQTTGSQCLYDYTFQRRTALVVGNERNGISEEILALVDDTIEIPVYGTPLSYNVVTAAAMAIYEYNRQFPAG